MDETRLSSFIESLEQSKDPILENMRKEALENDVPVIRPETEALLVFFLKMLKPKRILEIGCAVGYSSCVMASVCPEAKIDTIENYEPRIVKAKENFKKAGVLSQVTLYEGDAIGILAGLEGPYDLIFMDAAKGQYIRWLSDCYRLLKSGGLLFSDNVLSGGDILEARTVVDRRNRTIHKRMRDFLFEIKHSPLWESAVIPAGDGVSLSLKREGEESHENDKS